MAKITTQEAPALLDTVFKPFKDQLPYPTMLYVTWGESKVSGLTGVSSGDALRLSMNNGKQKSATNIRLGTFTYNATPAPSAADRTPTGIPRIPAKSGSTICKAKVWRPISSCPKPPSRNLPREQFQQATLGVFWNLARGVNLANDLAKSLTDNLGEVKGLVDEIGAALDNGGKNPSAR